MVAKIMLKANRLYRQGIFKPYRLSTLHTLELKLVASNGSIT